MEIAGYVTIGLIVLGMIVEITPVKVSPLAYIGRKLNKSLNDKIDTMNAKVDNLEVNVDEVKIDAIKNHILSYDALIRKGEHLKKYQYESAFDDINKWVAFHKKYPDLNGMIDIAIENIKEAYKNEKFD